MTAPAKKILVIEDELPLRHALCDALTHKGFVCVDAEDGEAGLRACLEHKPDLIILDLLMPKMDGMTMLKTLRKDEWGATANVILLTNYSIDDPHRVRDAIETAPAFYLVKNDWSVDDIVTKVESMSLVSA